ncbi:hypothetical protein [Mesorhizobium sp. CAU 1732]|uniref:hypothetical protein n=1 Tax=Mesorhizobium sp. CAU 1732 TaxID=3140358 RepID=UPI003261B261
MATISERAAVIWRELAARFVARNNEGPIDTIAGLEDFAATRSAFVAQKKLYGYLKTRMGTSYRTMFENDVFIQSVNIAKMHVYAACLSDLTIHCVAKALSGHAITTADRERTATSCYRSGIEQNADHAPSQEAVAEWLAAFDKRLGTIHWENAAATGDVFELSPKALVKWAPIANELKKYDAEIVLNSVRFAWNEVRTDFRTRLDAEAIQDEIEVDRP